jgi:peroxiredoxin
MKSVKNSLEILANLAIVLVALIVGAQAVRTWTTAPSAAASASPAAARRVYNPGEALPQLAPIDFARADRTVVLVLRKGCTYCDKSMPFYQKLLTGVRKVRPGVQVAVVSSDPVEVSREYLAGNQLDVNAIATSRELKVPGTPTVIVVDKQGKVAKVWVGLLDMKQQQDVWDSLTP